MLFFDPRRYDLSRFGRYKMNKKLSLARRIMDHVAAENVVDPFTGEILVEAKEDRPASWLSRPMLPAWISSC